MSGAIGALVLVVATAPAGAASGPHVRDTKDGFTFLLPSGWNQVSLKSGDAGALLGNAARIDSHFKNLLSGQAKSAAQKGLKVLCVSSHLETSSFVPNLNVGVYSGAPSLSDLDLQVNSEWTSFGAKSVHTSEVHFRFGGAVEVTYLLPLTATKSTVSELQVYIPHGSSTFIVTFTALSKRTVLNTVAAVMPTWQFTKA